VRYSKHLTLLPFAFVVFGSKLLAAPQWLTPTR
jgi:hypothetical protein